MFNKIITYFKIKLFGYKWLIIFYKNRNKDKVCEFYIRSKNEYFADKKAWDVYNEKYTDWDTAVHNEIKLIKEI